MILTRRHIAQIFLRRPSALFSSRGILTSISRPVFVAFPRLGAPRARAKRLFSTNYEVIPATFGPIIEPEEYDKLLAYASVFWPPPPSVPPNWSCTWTDWEVLVSYYCFSPYYLMLPQIEMHVNLQYGIRGETRPILFSTERDVFVFAIVNSYKYFLFDGYLSALYRIEGVYNDAQLVELLAQGDDVLVTRLKDIEESKEGLSAIQRIFARDETVIPLLVEKFLHYTPVPTTPAIERNASEPSPEEDAQFAHHMSHWQEGIDLRNDDQSLEILQQLNEEVADLRRMREGENRSSDMEEEGNFEPVADEDVQWARKEVAKVAEVTDDTTQDDLPPEETENINRDTKKLEMKIKEILNEMKEYSLKTEDLKVMIATVQHLLERSDELPLKNRHAMALSLACDLEKKLEAIKKNPKVQVIDTF